MADSGAPSPPSGGMRVVSTRDTRGQRGRETARDMVLSMVAVFAAVAGVLVLAWPSTPNAVKPVEWQPLITAVADSADWPVLAPAISPSGWTATSARVESLTGGHRVVHVGWVTDDQQYVSVRQVDLAGPQAQDWVIDEIGSGEVTTPGWVDASSRRWTLSPTSDGVALVAEISGTTIIVTGTATQEQLQTMATALVER